MSCIYKTFIVTCNKSKRQAHSNCLSQIWYFVLTSWEQKILKCKNLNIFIDTYQWFWTVTSILVHIELFYCMFACNYLSNKINRQWKSTPQVNKHIWFFYRSFFYVFIVSKMEMALLGNWANEIHHSFSTWKIYRKVIPIG